MSDKFYGGIVAGSTDVSIVINFEGTADSLPVTGITAANLTAYYYRQGAASAVNIALVAGSLTSHVDGGVAEIHSTNAPGRYVLHLPDSAVGSGSDWVDVVVRRTSGTPAAYQFNQTFPLQSAALIADQYLKRDMSQVSGEASRSPLNALRFLRNKWDISGSVGSIYKEDDTTVAWTTDLTTQAGVNPVVGSDPA